MKAAEIQQFGLEALEVVDKPEPRPGPGQVLVRVRALSLNYRDLMVVEGTYNPRMRLPMVPLSDAAGEIVEVGEGVSRFRTGDRVAGIFMQAWVDGEVTEEKAASALGGAIQGVAAEYVVFHETGVVSIPDYLSFEEAASLPCAAVTAWNALVSTGQLKQGETVLIQGTGGVSLFALQIARIQKAEVIATSSSDEKLARVLAMGARDSINYRTTPDWHKRVRELTGGRGVDHIVEVGGAETLPKSLAAVRMGGVVSLIGVLSGRDPVPFAPILMRTIRLQGIYVGSRAMFEETLIAFQRERLKPVVDRVFDLTEIRDALQYMKSGGHFGKICLRVC